MATRHADANLDRRRLEEQRSRYAEKVLEAARAEIGAGAGARNITLNRTALRLFHYAAGGLFDASQVEAVLGEAAGAAGLPSAEVASTLRSARAAGEREPQLPEAVRELDAKIAGLGGGPRQLPARGEPREAEHPRRPPAAEVAALWESSTRLTESTRADAFLARRQLPRPELGALDVARVLPRGAEHRFPGWWPASWASTWALAVQAFEPDGSPASIHARAIRDVGDGPKTRWPKDHQAKGLLFADATGRALLGGESIERLRAVLLLEGLTDFLRGCLWAARRMTQGERFAVLGIAAGGVSALAAVRWPAGSTLLIATDHDKAGEEYAEKILAAVGDRVIACRLRWAQVQVRA